MRGASKCEDSSQINEHHFEYITRYKVYFRSSRASCWAADRFWPACVRGLAKVNGLPNLQFIYEFTIDATAVHFRICLSSNVLYLEFTVALTDSTNWKKVFVSRPWKLAQTTGLLFWLRYGHFNILPFCIVKCYLVTFYNTNISKQKELFLVGT